VTPSPSSASPLRRSARRYVAATLALAAAAAAAALAAPVAPVGDGGDLVTFLALSACAAFAQLRIIEIRANHGFPTSIAFLVTGALLLPPGLVALLALAQYLPELLMRRAPLPIQAFNIANGTLNVLAAWLAARAVTGGLGDDGAGLAVAGLVAAVVFVTLNHLLLAGVLKLARGHTLHASGLFSADSLSIDLAIALAGVATAALADVNLALVPTALASLFLAHRLLGQLAALHAHAPKPQTQPTA
jgi:hypothetical protein